MSCWLDYYEIDRCEDLNRCIDHSHDVPQCEMEIGFEEDLIGYCDGLDWVELCEVWDLDEVLSDLLALHIQLFMIRDYKESAILEWIVKLFDKMIIANRISLSSYLSRPTDS